ncbi:hypothetical protein KCU71_g81, partial [Aureobasidium melanogenum]
MVGLIESCVYAADDTPGCFTLYCRFDELRAVAASKTMFESALTTVSFTFVDHHELFRPTMVGLSSLLLPRV